MATIFRNLLSVSTFFAAKHWSIFQSLNFISSNFATWAALKSRDETNHFLLGKLWPRVFWPIRGDLFWFWFFGIDIIGIDIIVRTFITSQNKQKIEILILWKFKVKFSHWKCFSIWLHAKKRIKIIIPWKLSFKGRKCFKDNHFIVRLPSFRSTCIFYTEIMRK